MKIDTTIKTVTATRGKDGKPGNTRIPASPADAASIRDDVRLTPASGTLGILEAQLAEVDVADSGKIESVRQAIADGSFVVDEEAVAEGLIQESIDNITHQPQR